MLIHRTEEGLVAHSLRRHGISFVTYIKINIQQQTNCSFYPDIRTKSPQRSLAVIAENVGKKGRRKKINYEPPPPPRTAKTGFLRTYEEKIR